MCSLIAGKASSRPKGFVKTEPGSTLTGSRLSRRTRDTGDDSSSNRTSRHEVRTEETSDGGRRTYRRTEVTESSTSSSSRTGGRGNT